MDGPWTLLGPGTGSTYYDLDSAGLSSVRFIRIIDDGDGLGNVAGAGFDLDGIECMISTVGVRVIGKGNSLLSVTPNPASERISVRLMSPEKEGILDIYNSRGETMMTAPVTGSRLQLDISGFPPGLYFVNFTNYRTSEVTRLIKE
jgi:hypothetical protein